MAIRSLVNFADEERVAGKPDYLRRRSDSHADTVRALMNVISDGTRRGEPFLEGWVDFLALRHFVIPGLELGSRAYSQVVLGSPLWVADYDGSPPPG